MANKNSVFIGFEKKAAQCHQRASADDYPERVSKAEFLGKNAKEGRKKEQACVGKQGDNPAGPRA